MNGESAGRDDTLRSKLGTAWRIWPILALVLAGLTIVVSLWWPMGRDQGIFAWMGAEILAGHSPYTDAFDHKGPACYVHYALVQVAFGRGMWAIRLADGLLLIVGAAAAAYLANLVAGRTAAIWAAGLTGLNYYASSNTYWATAQPDGFAAVLAVVAAALMAARVTLWFIPVCISGLLVGFLALYKPPLHLLFALPVLLCLYTGTEAPSRRDHITRPLVWFVAVLIPVAVAAAWLQNAGALDEAVHTLFVFNPSIHSGASDLGRLLSQFEAGIRPRLPMLLLAIPGIAYGWHNHRSISVALFLWLFLSLAAIGAQGKFYQYQWQLLGPAAAIASGIAISAFTRLGRSLASCGRYVDSTALYAMLAALTLAACMLGGMNCIRETTYWTASATGLRSWDDYYSRFGSWQEQQETAHHLQAHTMSDEMVLVWGFDPLMNYLSQRRAPTRFGFCYPLFAASTKAPDLWERWQDELVRDLKRVPPHYVVLVHNDRNDLMPVPPAQFFHTVPALSDLLKEYECEALFGDFAVWRRLETPMRCPANSADD